MSSLAIFVLFLFNFITSIDHFKQDEITSNLFYSSFRINYYIDKEEIGFIYYDKFPWFNFSVLHTFYIYPPHRKQGHGKELLKYTCNLISLEKNTWIYIQPGPFELNNINCSNETNLIRLIEFYEKNGFTKVNKLVSYLACALYKIIGIEEDYNHLMVRYS